MRFFYAGLTVVAIAFIAIVLLISGSGSSKKTSTNTSAVKKPATVKLLDYSQRDASLVLIIKGKLVGEDQHKSVRITVSPAQRTIEILGGYNEVVERTKDYANNQSAYENFLRALNFAGFTRSRNAATIDDRGVCTIGNTYYYDVYNADGDQVSHLWSTSCTVDQGTLVPGSAPYIRQLFMSQITDYTKFTEGVPL